MHLYTGVAYPSLKEHRLGHFRITKRIMVSGSNLHVGVSQDMSWTPNRFLIPSTSVHYLSLSSPK
jgi:hypothetical protein